MIEDLRRNQIDSWIKTLPPLPPGWVYDFIPGEPKYNPETNAWETTMEAKPRKCIIIKDEDERIRNWIVNLLHKLHYNQTAQPMALKAIEYLEKQKEQKPAEWSEEDEEMLEYVIGDVNDAKQLFATKDAIDLCDKEIAWLNSLRDNYKKCNSRWKPSEEQMSMLLAVINDPNNAGAESCQMALKSLYEQLKSIQ